MWCSRDDAAAGLDGLTGGNKRPDLVIDAEVKGDIRLYHEVTLKIAEGARVGDIKRHYRD